MSKIENKHVEEKFKKFVSHFKTSSKK